MVVGHVALALGAKARHQRTSFGWFFGAAFALDLLWPLFLLLGIERVTVLPRPEAFNQLVFDSYPWSHSLAMSLLWGGVLAWVASRRGVDRSTALLIGALVPSHWVLDVIVHRADLPLWPGPGPKFGLALWNSVPGTVAVEGALFMAGLLSYCRATEPVDRIGSWGFWSLMLLLTVVWASGPWSPAPDPASLGWLGLTLWLLVAWAAWVDGHRAQRPSA